MWSQQQKLGATAGEIFDDPLHSTSQKYLEGRMPKLGSVRRFDDGREFVFVSTYNNDFVAGEVIGVGDAIKTKITNALTAASAGATELILDITGETIFGNAATLAKDRMAGGYIVISSGSGEGYAYRVKSNTVQNSDAEVTFTLYDELQVAVTAGTDCMLVGPPYHGVIECTATVRPVGVCVKPTTAGTNTRWEYFWVQRKGLAAVLVETASGIAAGEPVAAGASGGITDMAGDGTSNEIGVVAAAPTADDDFLAVHLNIQA